MVEATAEERAQAVLTARRNLGVYSSLISGPEYEQPAHVKLLVSCLEAVERGEINRLIVEMPPRSSKTTHISRVFPSWWMGKRPADGVILASYSDTLSTDNGRAVRDLIGHPKYPFGTKIRADVKSAGRWQTDAGGGLIAVGVGTGLTGWPFPGSLAVVDDAVKGRDDAESAIVRDSTWVWWQETLLTRLARGAAVILGGTRWHEDDLTGRVLNSAGASDWTVLRLPYLAESDDELGRYPGEPLTVFGTVPSIEKGEISAYGFSALYQQRPAPAGGGVFRRAWMERRYCTCGMPERCGNKPLPKTSRWAVIQTADIGGKQGVGHDPSAVATWGWDGISKYVLDYWSGQDEYADVKQKAISLNYQHKPRMLYVEDATWAQPLISDLRRAGLRVHAVPPRGSKWTRADDVSGDFEGGQVVLPESASWLDSFMHQLLSFPNASHDEAVDTTSLALSMLRAAPRQMGHTMTTQPVQSRQSAAERVFERLKVRRRA